MYKEVWNKYTKGFKFLLPFILVKVLCEGIGFNLGFNKYDLYNIFRGNLSDFKQAVMSNLAPILFIVFVGSLFYAFLMVVIKELINEKHIDYREDFKEGIGFYLRYLVLSIIIEAVLIGINLLGMIDMLKAIAWVLLIGITPIVIPCDSYLIYYNTSSVEAFKKGLAVGKKYFMEIFFLGIIAGIVSGVSGVSMVRMGLKTSSIIYVCMEFIITSVEMYLCMFVMFICKKEEKSVGKIIEC
ncbi:hypothetical protein CLLI_08950 [Clostridium liquoris]|jgi:hypothetical protein|uniref:Uncharacterized protein n=1 Tax=Clostridium liquoris TaxID=1289519 RepID=A0A2T0B6B6_9CLOT|nr:hypothetical protein [Clostridium liquoris]PRR79415.1 hypothetical protein CLLI_08950 [Clostridium liquoris]